MSDIAGLRGGSGGMLHGAAHLSCWTLWCSMHVIGAQNHTMHHVNGGEHRYHHGAAVIARLD